MTSMRDFDIEKAYQDNPDLEKANRKGNPINAAVRLSPKPKGNKYHAVRTGHYASKKEAEYADQLAFEQKLGSVSFWLEQVPFRLPGGYIHRLDFVVFKVMTLTIKGVTADTGIFGIQFVEVKGRDLPMGKLKRKQVEEVYHITIEVV